MPDINVNIIIPNIVYESLAQNENISYILGNSEFNKNIEGNNKFNPKLNGTIEFNVELN